ncbi:MAG: hypothetical protein HC877_13725 [Thioploca sp.]|nr:hypothetical protein [Thioploca sp.]
MTKLIDLFKKCLWILNYFLFVFSPIYFIIHLIFNQLHIKNSVLFLAGALVISFRLLSRCFKELYENIEIPVFSTIILCLGTILLTLINLLVGVDDSHDAYFYHLNTAIPIALYHDILDIHLYDLISYSQGYPKFGEFLQALGIQLTNYFWGYGLITVIVIPASYTTTYLLATRLGLESQYADKVALTYAFNPINIAQATTGYIDSIQALYVLTNILLAIRINNLFKLSLLLINLIALLNMKLTGVVMGSLIFLLAIFWNRKVIVSRDQLLNAIVLTIAAYLVGLSHYLMNFIHFRTLAFPFIDLEFAQYVANLYTGEGSKLEKIIQLFWSQPTAFEKISLYDTTQGAFSILWYPLPIFIGLALVKAIRRKDKLFLYLQALFWLLLILDPAVSMGRYVAYFQFLGFFAVIYGLKDLNFIHATKMLPWVTAILPISYLVLSSYILFNPKLGLITRRLAYYGENRLLITSATSVARQAFSYYYDINSYCSGYYWFLKFNRVDVQLTQGKPQSENYFYIYRDEHKKCTFTIAHDLSIKNQINYENGRPFFEMNNHSLFATEYCKWCLSELNCLYAPYYVDKYRVDLSQFPFKSAGEKAATVECLSLEGQLLKDTLKFQVN